jgi:hypothetical protein
MERRTQLGGAASKHTTCMCLSTVQTIQDSLCCSAMADAGLCLPCVCNVHITLQACSPLTTWYRLLLLLTGLRFRRCCHPHAPLVVTAEQLQQELQFQQELAEAEAAAAAAASGGVGQHGGSRQHSARLFGRSYGGRSTMAGDPRAFAASVRRPGGCSVHVVVPEHMQLHVVVGQQSGMLVTEHCH